MPWTELTPMDRQLQFVAEAQRIAEPFVALCVRFGIAPKTGYKWLARYVDARNRYSLRVGPPFSRADD
jgi:hypothetical protein